MHVDLKRWSFMFCYRNVGTVVGSPMLFVNKIICTCIAALCTPGKVSCKSQPDACICFKLCTVLGLINSRF